MTTIGSARDRGVRVGNDHRSALPVSGYSARRCGGDADLTVRSDLRRAVADLAAFRRETATDGEGRAAAFLADQLRLAGADVTLEREMVHGTYWRPHGLLSLLTMLAGLQRSRIVGAVVAGAAAAAAVDDLEMGPRLVRTHLLRSRPCTNVVANVGPSTAERTIVVHAHHDAAHSGVVFHPRIAEATVRAIGAIVRRLRTTPPMMWSAVVAPALVALGHVTSRRRVRRTGISIAAGSAAAFANIGRAQVVPGANDNLSGVAVLLALARSLAREPLHRTRVILFSSGAEESFLEGMQAFSRRHFRSLPPAQTTFLVVESVGSTRLLVLDGEGLLRLHRYPRQMQSLVRDCAASIGVRLVPPFRFRFATGGQIPARAGYPTTVLSSIDWYAAPRNYHWPTDVPERLDYDTVEDAARVVEAVVRRLDFLGS